jgi:alpha-glucosidase
MRSVSIMKGLVAAGYFLAGASAAAVLANRDSTAACPGYKASNVQTQQGNIVSADLNLAGSACNLYGTDLDNLVLQVEYETGKTSRYTR